MRLDIPVVQGSGDGSAHTLVRIGDTRVTRGSAAFEVTASWREEADAPVADGSKAALGETISTPAAHGRASLHR